MTLPFRLILYWIRLPFDSLRLRDKKKSSKKRKYPFLEIFAYRRGKFIFFLLFVIYLPAFVEASAAKNLMLAYFCCNFLRC